MSKSITKEGRELDAALTALVEKHGIDMVLAGLADVCFEKADRFKNSFTGKDLERAARKRGDKLAALANSKMFFES